MDILDRLRDVINPGTRHVHGVLVDARQEIERLRGIIARVKGKILTRAGLAPLSWENEVLSILCEHEDEVAPAPNDNPHKVPSDHTRLEGGPTGDVGHGKAGGDHMWEQQCKRCGNIVLAGDDFEYCFCAPCYEAGWRFSRDQGLYNVEGDD